MKEAQASGTNVVEVAREVEVFVESLPGEMKIFDDQAVTKFKAS